MSGGNDKVSCICGWGDDCEKFRRCFRLLKDDDYSGESLRVSLKKNKNGKKDSEKKKQWVAGLKENNLRARITSEMEAGVELRISIAPHHFDRRQLQAKERGRWLKGKKKGEAARRDAIFFFNTPVDLETIQELTFRVDEEHTIFPGYFNFPNQTQKDVAREIVRVHKSQQTAPTNEAAVETAREEAEHAGSRKRPAAEPLLSDHRKRRVKLSSDDGPSASVKQDDTDDEETTAFTQECDEEASDEEQATDVNEENQRAALFADPAAASPESTSSTLAYHKALACIEGCNALISWTTDNPEEQSQVETDAFVAQLRRTKEKLHAQLESFNNANRVFL